MHTVITRKQAISEGLKHYFTNKPCKKGHIDKRYVANLACMTCAREKSKIDSRIYYHKNKDKNREKLLEQSRRWRQENPEKRKEVVNRSAIKHRKTKNKQSCLYNKERRKEPGWRLSKNMSKSIWDCLKLKKNHKSWKQFVDYTLEELQQHLECKFTLEMCWNNYGSYWHIDHIKPQSWFNLDNMDEFKQCWDLNNLQPLEAIKNYSKNNRYIG